jgi:hypothetical protein
MDNVNIFDIQYSIVRLNGQPSRMGLGQKVLQAFI